MAENARLLVQIKEIHIRSRRIYGVRKVYSELRSQGFRYNRKRIVRLMRENGIRSKVKRKYKVTTHSDHTRPIAENLVNQNFTAKAPNRLWCSDITYIYTQEGWLYLCCILDVFDRKIVGWAMSSRLKDTLVLNALRMAVRQRKPGKGLIFHSDRGSQYASRVTIKYLKRHEFIQSMSGKGNCYDNAIMESFFHLLKSEHVSFQTYRSRQEAKNSIFDYIEIFYNRKRRHSALGYCSPEEYDSLKKVS